jgi:phenylacetate-CoA ligase
VPPLLGLSRRLSATPEAVRAVRDRALRRLVAHAARSVRFYRDRWPAGAAAGVRTADDLGRLPIVTKREMRAAPLADRMRPGADPRRMVHARTSGSGGEPFDIYRTLTEELAIVLCARRAWRQHGFRSGERSVWVGGGFIDRDSWRGRLFGVLREGVHQRISVLQSPEAMLAQLARARPTVVGGYPGVLSMLARRLAAGDVEAVTPRLVVVGGEVLTDEARALIARGFGGATVREIYGTHEAGLLAWECHATGRLHVNDDFVALEVEVDGRGAREGEEGEVVITALHSRAMPFVRYRLADLAVRGPSPCPCGAPFSTLERVRGRRLDYYKLPGGRLLHHYELFGPATMSAGVRDAIDRFQVVQERVDRFVVRVALLDPHRPPDLERLRRELAARVGDGCEVVIEIVERIDFEPSGKYQTARSLVPDEP